MIDNLMMKSHLRFFALVFVLLELYGCQSNQAMRLRERFGMPTSSLTEQEVKEIASEADQYWNNRQRKMDLVKAIALYEKIVEAQEDSFDYLVRLARAYYFLADAHYQNPQLKRKYWQMGVAYGERAMASNKDYQRVLFSGKRGEDHLDLLTKDEVPAIYWTATNLGRWSKESGITSTLNYHEKIRSYIIRIQELEPDYYHGAIDRYWGGYYAVAPSFAGGDLQKSRTHFERSIKQAPYYLGTKILFAQMYAKKTKNRKLYKKLLKEVMNASPDHDDVYPENLIEQQRASILLKNIDESFKSL